MTTPMNQSKGLFRPGGFLDRRGYLIAILQIAGIATAGTALLLGIYASGSGLTAQNMQAVWSPWVLFTLSAWFAVTFILFQLCIVYLSANTLFKRLRDIRGTQEHELGWQVASVVLSVFPYASLALQAFLLFKEGLVSSPGSALPVHALLRTFHGNPKDGLDGKL